jgi:hypothetical protein
VLIAAAVQWSSGRTVSATSRQAEALFGSGPVDSLLRLVDCERCELRVRERAVWALGEMGDRHALPALRAHLTGRKCDHQRGLSQYELDKAIRKIEKTWSVVQKVRL